MDINGTISYYSSDGPAYKVVNDYLNLEYNSFLKTEEYRIELFEAGN